MTDTIERIARAIADNIGPPFDRLHKNKRHWTKTMGVFEGEHRDVNGPFQDDCLEAAKACLSALEEPSERQIQAAANAESWSRSNGAEWTNEAAYRAMIKAAKGGEG